MRKQFIILSILLAAVMLTACAKQPTPQVQAPNSGNTAGPSTGGNSGTTSSAGQVNNDNSFDTSKGFTDKNGCYDSDGGTVYDVKGYIIDASNTRYEDNCTSPSALKEYYCGPVGYKAEQSFPCPGGCSNGACIPVATSPNICKESGVHLDYNNQGTVSYQGQTYTDYCNDTSNLVKYYCTNVGVETLTLKYCSTGCKDGACAVPPPSSSTCTDSDLGPDQQYIKGTVTDPNGAVTDSCLNSNTVKEWRCNSVGFRASTNIGCANGCVDGACVR